jgi:hypothetical protein
MEFLVIMAVGTAIAVWVVIGCRPSRPRFVSRRTSPSRQFFSPTPPPWKKDTAASNPIGELEYLEMIERYNKDPQQQPFPLPPPVIKQK